MPSIKDHEVKILATCSLTLQSDYPSEGDDAWKESPFNWIRTRRSSRQRGYDRREAGIRLLGSEGL